MTRHHLTCRRLTPLLVAAGLLLLAAPQAASSPLACPTGIGATMAKVNDYWLAHNPNPKGVAWTTGAYFTGDLAAASALPDTRYETYAQNWATAQHFALKGGPTDTNANSQAVGQDYIALYQADPRHPAGDIAQIDQSVRTMVASKTVDDWSWIDALFMAMPDFAELGVIENDPAYFDKMSAEFQHTHQGLWNAGRGLWWRDSTFVGQNVYWSRGNGWVIAALAKVLDVLPVTDPHRASYVQTFQQMAAALKAAQQPSGFWPVSLGDPTQYPGPETSGTAFFTYGIAWGVEHGILAPATYLPVVTAAWNAMASTSVQPNGSLGYVQGPASGPADGQPVTASSTASYGVGALLLAGGELIGLCSS
ncbi:MAG TPA: glycoside hydrolase family 88 protein [Pseudonocardiaceae bacterium]|nr:glycoside hydrolase family 88 protein [Pseudonocardiaceae bacterium]